nr:lysine-specific demethylase JMJ30 isoform X2 [Tanacetum cinerariifolium]
MKDFSERDKCAKRIGAHAANAVLMLLMLADAATLIQELRNDIIILDYCFAGGTEMKSVNAWFGPAGTVTPLHHDPRHNIIAQVVGKKYVRLYPASLFEELYPQSESMLKNSSQISCSMQGTPKSIRFVEEVLPKAASLRTKPDETRPLSEFQSEVVQLAAVLNGDHFLSSFPD